MKNIDDVPVSEEFEVIVRTLKFPDSNYKLSLNVKKFWEENKEERPELYRVAQIVYGTPDTQVSVERLFSLLNDLLSPKRNQLKDSTIEKILFLKVNLDVLLELTEREKND